MCDIQVLWPPAKKSTNEDANNTSKRNGDWLEKEILTRLLKLDEKLDEIALHLNSPSFASATIASDGHFSPSDRPPLGVSLCSLCSTSRNATLARSGDHSSKRGSNHSNAAHITAVFPEDTPGKKLKSSSDSAIGNNGHLHQQWPPSPLAAVSSEDPSHIMIKRVPPSPLATVSSEDRYQTTSKKLPSVNFGNQVSLMDGEKLHTHQTDSKYASDMARRESSKQTIHFHESNSSNKTRITNKSSFKSYATTQPSEQPPNLTQTVRLFFDDADSGPLAKIYGFLMPFVSLLSAFLTVLQSAENTPLCETSATIVEFAFEIFFTVEISIRFAVSPVHACFFVNTNNLIDLLGIFPLPLRLATRYSRSCEGIDDGMIPMILLGIVPVIRILKCVRRFEKFELILCAAKSAAEALPVCLYCLLLLTMSFSSLIFIVEPRDNITDLPQAMWLTIVTATTVGYGDMTPQSTAGHFIVAMLVVSSVIYLSMPISMVGQCFNEVWEQRDCILLRRRVRDCLQKWGYLASDIPLLFDMFDGDGDGEIDLREFKRMFRRMKVDLSSDRIAKLFESIDQDGSGKIDDKEFIKGLFGFQAFHDIYTDSGEVLPSHAAITLGRGTIWGPGVAIQT